MKNLKQHSIFLVSFFLFAAFSTNGKLTQGGAERAIRQYITSMNASSIGSKVNIVEVLSIDTVNQRSDNKANCLVTVKGIVQNSGSDSLPIACTSIETKLKIGFVFEKKTDNNWVLTGVGNFTSNIRVPNEYLQKYHKLSSGLNISAQ